MKASYAENVELSRIIGEFNTGILLIGMALVTGKIVEVYHFAGDSYRLQEQYVPEDHDGTVLPLLYEADHYTVGIPLDKLATFVTSDDKPKTALTHDNRGKPRVVPLKLAMMGRTPTEIKKKGKRKG